MVAQIESRKYRVSVDDIARRNQNMLANLSISINDRIRIPIAGITESIRSISIVMESFATSWMKDIQPLISDAFNDMNEVREIAGDHFLTAAGDYTIGDIRYWWHEGIYSISELSEIYKAILFIRQDKKCNGCRKKMPLHALQWDHVIARSENGDDRIMNMQLLCSWCNSVKGNRGMEYLHCKVKERRMRNKDIVRRVRRAKRSRKKGK